MLPCYQVSGAMRDSPDNKGTKYNNTNTQTPDKHIDNSDQSQPSRVSRKRQPPSRLQVKTWGKSYTK